MSQDDQVHQTWNLAHPDGDQVTIDLWVDGETVRVDGGDNESTEGGPGMVDRSLAKYQAAGYRVSSAYEVNDPASSEEPVEEDDPEPHGRPEKCPDCGAPVVYDPSYSDDFREGAAWLCTGCKWGQWLTA